MKRILIFLGLIISLACEIWIIRILILMIFQNGQLYLVEIIPILIFEICLISFGICILLINLKNEIKKYGI